MFRTALLSLAIFLSTLIPFPAQAGQTDLAAVIASIQSTFVSPSLTPENCPFYVDKAFHDLYDFTPDLDALAPLKAESGSDLRQLFLTRLTLQDRLRTWYTAGSDTTACARSAKQFLWMARGLEDWLGQWDEQPAPYDPAHRQNAFTGESPALLVNPKFGTRFDAETDLRSGDVITSRGMAYTSAAIAQIGDQHTSFSHASLVHRQGGEFLTAEAHIEVGTLLRPFSAHLADGNMREVVFRQTDADLGQKASQSMVDRIRSRSTNIPYNFHLDLNNRSELFCTQLIANAYETASDGAMIFPVIGTTFSKPNHYLLDQLGISASQSFMPGDVGVDPRFELVAEWRDFSRVRQARLNDAILDKIIEWSGTRGYVFKSRLKLTAKAMLAWTLRRSNLFSRKLGLDRRFPRNMPEKTLKTIFLLDGVSSLLYSELDRAEQAYAASTGVPMTVGQVHAWLEDFRVQDQKAGSKGKLHRLFAPRRHWHW